MSNPFPQQPDDVDPQQTPGSLERMGIAVETRIDEAVLTPSMAKAVHFRVSKPSGYSFQEVDDFVTNIVIPSIDWYVQTIYQRDSAVHALGRDLDLAETDNKNLKSQLQFAEFNSQVKEGIERNSDDKEISGLMERLVEAEAQLSAYRSGGEVPSSSGVAPSDEETEELRKYVEDVVSQYNELIERYNSDVESLQNQIESLQSGVNASDSVDTESRSVSESTPVGDEETAAHIQELEAYVGSITAQYNELLEAYNSLMETVGDGGGDVGNTVSYDKYSSVLAEKEQLQEQLDEALKTIRSYEDEDYVEEGETPARMLLATEESKAEADLDNPAYKNLPPGIRPDDL